METMKCTSCGETVLSTDKFCKQCGKPNEQITERDSENNAMAKEGKEVMAARESLSQSKEDKKKREEKIKLYSLSNILFATFLGGPVAAGILIRKNALNLRREKEGLIALIVGIVSTIIVFLVDEKIVPLFWLIYMVAVLFIVQKMHGQILKTHKEEGNEFYSGWKAAGIALICTIVCLGGLFAYYATTEDWDWDDMTSDTETEQFNSSNSYGESKTFNGTESSIPQNKDEQVYQITATDLYAAYKNNEMAADDKYMNKTLIVTGYIFEINKNYDGIYYIILANKGGDGFTSTFCYFPANRNSSLASLQKGQFVSIKGRCVGRPSTIFPQLNNCSLEVNATRENTSNKRQQMQESVREEFENLIKNNYGSQWYILNDKQANWGEYALENFILPARTNDPDYPYIIKGDFDGNGKLDYAATLSESNDNEMSKIIIILDNGNVHFWDLEPGLYSFHCITERKITSHYDDDLMVNLKGDGIGLGIYETGYSEVIYWTGSDFRSIYNGD